jgi:hypothetical protein
VLAIAIAVVFAAGAVLDVSNPKPCRHADELYHEQRLADARTAYIDLLGDEETEGCAAKGLDNVTRAQCAQAKSLLKAQQSTEATKAYLAIASTEPVRPAASCALDALSQLAKP